MKLSLSTWATTLLLTTPTFAKSGLVYFSNPPSVANPPTSLTANEVRLLLAQKLGLSRFHSFEQQSGEALEATLAALDSYGASPKQLFSGNAARLPHGVIVIEGIDINDPLSTESLRPVSMQHCPSAETSKSFLSQLGRQHISVHGQGGVLISTTPSSIEDSLSVIHDWINGVERSGVQNDLVVHARGIELIAKKAGTKSKEYQNALVELQVALQRMLVSNTKLVEFTLVFMPPESKGLFRRSSSASWGGSTKTIRQELDPQIESELELPDIAPEAAESEDIAFNGEQQETEEQSEDDRPSTEQEASAPLPNGDDAIKLQDEVSVSQSNTTIVPPLGILGVCYRTQDDCASVTRNCSGHGSCKLKFSNKDDESSRCYACSCQVARDDLGNGRFKTTVWAGPACQKRDISAPFWLLGSTAVGLLTVVAWGIGLLYSMGSEELPSVIGAGVAGPRPK